ncbi:MAG: hypothetical protein CMP23_01130 [Rickettsiales bacterium]|nr:hypothetical protein [Rickettsiales bacterium]
MSRLPSEPRLAVFVSLTLMALSLGLVGCDESCDRMCDAQADLMEACFPTWESSWQEQSYSSRDAFVERCYVVWGEAAEASDEAEAQAVIAERCRVQLQIALADEDCESVLQIDP